MSVFRVTKTKNYTVMSNHHLKDKNLSFKAKGLLSYMLSLPDDWDYSLEGLCKVSKDNITSIKSCISELKQNNYLEITKERNAKGQFEWIYNIFENPKPCIDFLSMDNPSMENQRLLNTKELNTKNQKKKIKRKRELEFEKSFSQDIHNFYEN